MSLPKTVYKTLEDVLGPENITDDPAIMEAYRTSVGYEVCAISPFYRPAAVVLPGSTEDLQAVVKICNRYRISFLAIGTGLGAWAIPSEPGMILMDLKRMNKIVEINEKNMYAVVEPYVTHAQLSAELMKRGLRHHSASVGGQTSVLANCLHCGNGFGSFGTSTNHRNLIAVEWVLPTGEVLRIGSPGMPKGEWFCGDGPGPSLRGIVRGFWGAMSGMGVFTKAALKVYHWPGPETFPHEGVAPSYDVKLPEDKFKAFTITYRDWESLAEAAHAISRAEIGIGVCRFPPSLAILSVSSNEEFWDTLSAGFLQTLKEFSPHLFAVLLGANSSRELEYQEKVLNKIIEETGGEIVELLNIPESNRQMLGEFIRPVFTFRGYRMAGRATSVRFGYESIDHAIAVAKSANKIYREYMDKGAPFVDIAGADMSWVNFVEHGHWAYCETGWAHAPFVEKGESESALINEEYYLRQLKDDISLKTYP
ncbi:MAG: FAD-binding oxidoreductase, partial [Aigarchaeota archaeon]|nr:FAD-binding oxidoreductase [Aigarchaeota archaeon]